MPYLYYLLAIPNEPFTFEKLASVQNNISELKNDLDKNIGKNNCLSISVFPSLGCGDDYFHLPDVNDLYPDEELRISEINHREARSNNQLTNSNHTHDIIISSHPTFDSYYKFGIHRTGKKPTVLVPIYKDVNTEKDVKDEIYPGFIYSDSRASGMGNCCFQVTVGIESFHLACQIYDQLIPIMPIITALCGSSPFFKGKLSNYDHRFQILSQSCDERSDEEKDPKNENYIFCSRYSFIYSYISDSKYVLDHHNDLPKMPINQEYYKKLRQKFSERFSTHICNLLVRDPQVIYEDKLSVEDPNDNTHFLSFLCTNYNSLRFKPPAITDNDNMFKIEIRPCDLQLTPFENAAIATFLMLYVEFVKSHDVNFIIPLSKANENFEKSVLIDSVVKDKFQWRTNCFSNYTKNSNIKDKNSNTNTNKNDNLFSNISITDNLPEDYLNAELDEKNNIKLLSIEEIFNGTKQINDDDKNNYKGLMKYLSDFAKEKFTGKDLELILSHLNFLRLRSEGKYIKKII